MCQGPGEARPRVGGAGCASPSRLRVRSSGHGVAPRPLRAAGRGRRYPRPALGFSGSRWPGPSSGNYRTLRKDAKRPCPLRERSCGDQTTLPRVAATGFSLEARPLCSRTARGALGAAATHALLAPGRRGVQGRLPRQQGAGGGGCAVDSRESAQRSNSLLRHVRNEKGRGGAYARCPRGGGTQHRHFAGDGRTARERGVGVLSQPGNLGGGETLRWRSATEEAVQSSFCRAV